MKTPSDLPRQRHALHADFAEFRAAFHRDLRAQRRWFVGVLLAEETVILAGAHAMLVHFRHFKP